MSFALGTALDRIVALEKEALAALSPAVTCDAVPYFFHHQDEFPFWTNRIAPFTVRGGLPDALEDEDFDTTTIGVVMRLVIGHVTQGYVGENEANLKTWIPQVIRYFNDRPGLQTTAAPTHLNDLWWARITAGTGFAILQSTGLSTQQVGCEFTLTCRFSDEVELQYP